MTTLELSSHLDNRGRIVKLQCPQYSTRIQYTPSVLCERNGATEWCQHRHYHLHNLYLTEGLSLVNVLAVTDYVTHQLTSRGGSGGDRRVM